MKKRLIRIGGWILLLPVLAFAAFVLYVTITDYKPEERIVLDITNNNNAHKLSAGQPFTVTTFNIGYASLDQGQDFFMDGGTASRGSSKEQTLRNLSAITESLRSASSDFLLIQEVDRNSTRSFKVDQAHYLTSELTGYGHAFAYNYKTPWVPIPLTSPMGTVQSGLLTLSAFNMASSTRFDLPGKESWPYQLFELDRAFIESRIPLDSGKELVLVNLHLSAFDKGGYIRKQQLDYLANYLNREMEADNYIILGGDWNHSLPGTDPAAFPTRQQWPDWLQPFPDGFEPEGFAWAVDPHTATVRTLDTAYEEGINFTAVIDGFLVSPNIEIVEVKARSLGYEHSDHNPVTGVFTLTP
ncbi:endonuclease/exonuclease/phosphatase family protein [Paenibacillaceae bacterium]|nr:endonuclease/exonuclease/phosphatase family protein [Paenibacillaceae bacterium]